MEEYERNGCTIKIELDDDPQNPRDWDNVGTMICSHRDYNLGDEQFDSEDYEGWEDLKQHLIDERGAVVVLPLGLYDHSGITMYVGDTHDRWDRGQVGFIYATADDLLELNADYSTDEGYEQAEKYLRGEVENYDKYLTGQVFGYTVSDPDGDDIASCWGYYDEDQCKQDAEAEADAYVRLATKMPPRQSFYAKSARRFHG